MSPVLGQFQDPLVVEGVARKTKLKVKNITTIPDSLWKSALKQQLVSHGGGFRVRAKGDAGLLRLPCPTDLYILATRGPLASEVNENLTTDTPARARGTS